MIQYNIIYNKKLSGYDILLKSNGEFFDDDLIEDIFSDNEIYKTEHSLYFISIQDLTLSNEEFEDILTEISQELNVEFVLDKSLILSEDYKTKMYYFVSNNNFGQMIEIVQKDIFDKEEALSCYPSLKLDTVLLENYPNIGLIAENMYSFEEYSNNKEEIKKMLDSLDYFSFEYKENNLD